MELWVVFPSYYGDMLFILEKVVVWSVNSFDWASGALCFGCGEESASKASRGLVLGFDFFSGQEPNANNKHLTMYQEALC